MPAEAMRPVAGQSARILDRREESVPKHQSNGDTQQPQHANRPTPNGMSQGYGSEVRDGIRLRYECVMLYERTRESKAEKVGTRKLWDCDGGNIQRIMCDYLSQFAHHYITRARECLNAMYDRQGKAEGSRWCG